jgi:diguanylate cyclase (GGDEF)-like protein
VSAPATTARRLLLVFLPIVGLAALLALQMHEADRISAHRVGFDVGDQTESLRITAITEGLPADRAGLQVGDRVVALDGQRMRDVHDYDRIAQEFERGQRILFTVERDGVRLELPVVSGVAVPRLELALNAIVVALHIALALLALMQWQEDRRARLLYLFAMAVAFEYALPTETLNATLLGVSTNLAFYLVSGFQMGVELHLASLIPDRPGWLRRRPWVVVGYYTVGAVLSGAVATALVAEVVFARALPWSMSDAEAVLLNWGLPLWGLAVPALLGHRFLTHPERRGRLQAGIVMLGVLPWSAVVAWQGALQIFGRPSPSVPPSVWALVGLAYPIAVFVAVFRYHLFDLEWVMRRSVLYGALTSALVLTFYGALGAGGALFAGALEGGHQSVWVVSAATLLLGLLFNPLRNRLERWIDHRLFPERDALRQRVIALVAELPAYGKLPRMGEHLAAELCRIFDLDAATIWVATAPVGQLIHLASTRQTEVDSEQTLMLAPDDPGLKQLARSGKPQPVTQLARSGAAMAQRLSTVDADLAVPLVSQEKLIGVLLLGAKRGGMRFSAEELELLTLLSHHAATVFENARLFDSATFEGLTGLYRREAVLEILDREWNRSVRYARPLAIAVADLDRFKSINDQHGHLAGDLVLQKVAGELKGHLRETDFIGRFGGEEFLMVLPETSLEGARAFAEKIRQRLEGMAIPLDDGGLARVTVSIGVASREGLAAQSRARARALIAAADEALYAAKNRGRNRVETAPGPVA